MKKLEIIVMFPLAIFCLLSLMVIDSVRVAKGKPTMDEEWHDIYMNRGQGSRE